MKNLVKKKSAQPTIAERIEQAQTLSGGAMSLFIQAANDLEIAAELKTEVADDLDVQAAELQAQAEALRDQADVLDTESQTDLSSAIKIRDFFAV